MKKSDLGILAVAVAVSLVVGGAGGFILGAAMAKAGRGILGGVDEQEALAALREVPQDSREIRDGVEVPGNRILSRGKFEADHFPE